jgi:hypothetical protein
MIVDKAKIIEKLEASAPNKRRIDGAQRYEPVSDLCILTSYFNPCGYSGLLKNYLSFSQSIVDSGLNFITVECAFSGAPFQLPAAPNVIQVRSDSIIWQKECLLNVALAVARQRFPKIAWLDADIFFADPQWALRTSDMLDQFQIVQPFSEVILLPQGMTRFEGIGQSLRGIASVLNEDPNLIKEPYFTHGHTGYAWAARTEALPEGFFDGCLLGCGDHVMAHAMFGDTNSECVQGTFCNDVAIQQYFDSWANSLFERVQGSVGCLPGTILHHWHGDPKKRNYLGAAQKLARFGVDPKLDLEKNADALWEWKSNRKSLQKYVAEYFVARNEDKE